MRIFAPAAFRITILASVTGALKAVLLGRLIVTWVDNASQVDASEVPRLIMGKARRTIL